MTSRIRGSAFSFQLSGSKRRRSLSLRILAKARRTRSSQAGVEEPSGFEPRRSQRSQRVTLSGCVFTRLVGALVGLLYKSTPATLDLASMDIRPVALRVLRVLRGEILLPLRACCYRRIRLTTKSTKTTKGHFVRPCVSVPRGCSRWCAS